MTKRQFFKRKNRDNVYRIYKQQFESVQNYAGVYLAKLGAVKALMDSHKNNTHLYEFLKSVVDCVDTYAITSTAYLYDGMKFNGIDDSMRIYNSLISASYKLSHSIGRLNTAIELVTTLDKKDLSITK